MFSRSEAMQAAYRTVCLSMVQPIRQFARVFCPFDVEECRNATVRRQTVWQSHNACWIIDTGKMDRGGSIRLGLRPRSWQAGSNALSERSESKGYEGRCFSKNA